ncbi:MAG: hypothetical protein EOP17_00400 [Rhizobiaceae bacterium]|nr:MAG: hypothetical protein EOP17_00400 [Rhizobiaceae bacterium]
MSFTAEEALAQSRAGCTTEERVVVALESIADRLLSLVEFFKPVGSSNGMQEFGPSKCTHDFSRDVWENEGGRLDLELADSFGIKHFITSQFEFGRYRYTNLADAVSEAKRTQTPPS